MLSPEVVDLNTVIGDAVKMLKRLIGENIEIRFIPAESLWPVMADPGQLGYRAKNESVPPDQPVHCRFLTSDLLASDLCLWLAACCL